MFDIWSLGIPVPEKYADELNKLILSIAEKEPSLGLDKKLLQKINPKAEFHVTIWWFWSYSNYAERRKK